MNSNGMEWMSPGCLNEKNSIIFCTKVQRQFENIKGNSQICSDLHKAVVSLK